MNLIIQLSSPPLPSHTREQTRSFPLQQRKSTTKQHYLNSSAHSHILCQRKKTIHKQIKKSESNNNNMMTIKENQLYEDICYHSYGEKKSTKETIKQTNEKLNPNPTSAKLIKCHFHSVKEANQGWTTARCWNNNSTEKCPHSQCSENTGK